MVECPNCHTLMVDGSRFCGNCGTPIPQADPILWPTPESETEPENAFTPEPEYERTIVFKPELETEPTPVFTPEPGPVFTPEPAIEPEPVFTPEPEPEPTPVFMPEPASEPTPVFTPELASELTNEPMFRPPYDPSPAFTPEPTPTFTPEPTPAFTPEPTPTFTPEPTPTFTPEPTPTFTPEPTPAFMPGPAFDPDRWPNLDFYAEAAPSGAPMGDRPVGPQYAAMFCPYCGEKNSTEFAFCQRCGRRLADEPETGKKRCTSRSSRVPKKKLLLFGGIVLAVIILAVGAILLLSGKGIKNNGAFYLKDGEINYKPISAKAPAEITSRLFSDDNNSSDLSSTLNSPYLCRDGKTMIYPDRWDSNNNYALYFRDIGNMKKDAVKIDSGVNGFYVNDGETLITYRKSDGAWYWYSLNKQEKEKIAAEVRYAKIAGNGDVAYTDSDNNLYLKRNGKDKEKLASNVDELHWISPDGKTVLYSKDDNLYMHMSGKDREKIASDVFSVLPAFDDGSFYYIKENDDRTLMDFVRDDNKLSDSEKRYLREELEEDVSGYFYELYRYDGKESTLLSDLFRYATISSFPTYSLNREKQMMLFRALDEDNYEPVRLSEFASVYWDGIEKLEAAFDDSTLIYVASGNTIRPVELEDVDYCMFSSDGSNAYFICDYESDEGDLYQVSLSGSGTLRPELLDSDVYYYLFSVQDSKVCYFKDVNYDDNAGVSLGEMYIDGKRIDSDVYPYVCSYRAASKTLLYITDWNKNGGTLCRWSGGKSSKIADDVYSRVFTPNGDVLYLVDYNTKSRQGDLYRFSGSKSEKIDEDVTRILTVRTAK